MRQVEQESDIEAAPPQVEATWPRAPPERSTMPVSLHARQTTFPDQ
jgi:hypothetical protein